jgi:hypothetical protein
MNVKKANSIVKGTINFGELKAGDLFTLPELFNDGANAVYMKCEDKLGEYAADLEDGTIVKGNDAYNLEVVPLEIYDVRSGVLMYKEKGE